MFGITFAYCIPYVSSIFMYILVVRSVVHSVVHSVASLRQVVLLAWAARWEVLHVDHVRRAPTARKARRRLVTCCDSQTSQVECNGMQWNAMECSVETYGNCIKLYRFV